MKKVPLKETKCAYCGKTFKHKRFHKRKYCDNKCAAKGKLGNKFAKGHKPTNSFKKGHTPWNKSDIKIYCQECGKEIWPREKLSKKFCSNKCKYKYFKGKIFEGSEKGFFKKGENIGDKSLSWKGKKASYGQKHFWVKLRVGRAKEYKCVFCGKQAQHWANIDHKYSRELDDYIPLCVSCHFKWDYKYNGRKSKKRTI